MISVTKKFEFESAHYLENTKLSIEDNLKTFGACSGFRTQFHDPESNTIKYHGHSYKMEVTVRGKINPETGLLINFSDLKKIVNKHVIDIFDHETLNHVMPKEYRPCTVENMLRYITKETRLLGDICDTCGVQGITVANVSSIKIWETESSFAEWDSSDI